MAASKGKQPNPTPAQRAARRVVRTTNKFATTGEGVGVVQRALGPKPLPAKFVQRYRSQVAAEIGPKAAQRAVKALKTLDKVHTDIGKGSASRAATGTSQIIKRKQAGK